MDKKTTKATTKVSKPTAKKLPVKKVSKSKEKAILATPEMFLNKPCRMWNFDGDGYRSCVSLETAETDTPTAFDPLRGFSWGSKGSYARAIALSSDPTVSMIVVPRKIVVRIPNRFMADVACWEGEIEDSGNSSRNLGEAVKAAIKVGANLQGANLRGANLQDTNLQGADLQGANLQGANLQGANLRGANLQGANLQGANLQGANLRGANLRGANLRGANLQGADLQGADLQGANLRGAKNAELTIARTRILPEGALIGWKKLRGNIIAKLRIPEGAKRSHAFGRKCRAEFAEVLELLNPDGSPATKGTSQHDSSFVYTVGATVRPANGFSENWMEECESGIHFFITKIEAENY